MAVGRLDKAIERARGRRRGLPGAIHAEEILDADLGAEDDAAEGPTGGRAQTSIAVDGSGQHIVVAFNDTR